MSVCRSVTESFKWVCDIYENKCMRYRCIIHTTIDLIGGEPFRLLANCFLFQRPKTYRDRVTTPWAKFYVVPVPSILLNQSLLNLIFKLFYFYF